MSGKPDLKSLAPRLAQVYAQLAPDFQSQRLLIFGSMAAMVLGLIFRLLEPWPLKVFLDAVLQPGEPGVANRPFASWQPATLLVAVAIAGVLITTCRAFADYASRVGFFNVGNRLIVKVRDRLFRHVQDLSMAFHSRSRTGDLVVRVTRDVSLLRDVLATALLPLLGSVAILFAMLIVMFVLSWQLTLMSLATLPLFWFSTIRLGRRIREAARKQRQREGAMADTATEALGAMQGIKAMGLEDRFASLFSRRNRQSQKEDLKASRLSLRLGRSVDILLALSTSLVLYFGGRLALQGDLSAGDIVVFLTYLKRSFKPAEDFAKYLARLAKAAAAGERVLAMLNRRPEIADRPDARIAAGLHGSLRLEQVTFGFERAHPVLRDISLEVQPGELVALVGPSGSGKSTILAHVLRLYDPWQGRVCVDGQDVRAFTQQSWRTQISTVMQDAVLLAASIHDNIACGALGDVDRGQVVAAARAAHADEFIQQIPGGYDALVGERGCTLSRGQRQRIAIARAAMRPSPLLLLDEPTAGLDEENEQRVIDALWNLAMGRATLMATHCLPLAARANRIVFIEGGRIVEQGTHDSLLHQHGRYAQWHHRQANRTRRQTRLAVFGA